MSQQTQQYTAGEVDKHLDNTLNGNWVAEEHFALLTFFQGGHDLDALTKLLRVGNAQAQRTELTEQHGRLLNELTKKHKPTPWTGPQELIAGM